MVPKFLIPEYEYDLVRLGRNYDGGYLVEKYSIENSKFLLSAGMAWDFSFEKDYLKKTGKTIYCYDHTLNFQYFFFTWLFIFFKRLILFQSLKKIFKAFNNIFLPIKFRNFFKNKKTNYIKFGLGLSDNRVKTLDEIIFDCQLDKDIFIKIDIEGDEYRILDDLAKHSDKIIGLVIEFHNSDLHYDQIEKFIKDFELKIVHLHANNSGPLNKYGDPTILEVSFAKDPQKIGPFKSVHNNLDQPNIKNKKDIDLKF